MTDRVQAEVDANFEAFQEMPPELHKREADRWALMRHGECVGFFDTLRDAHVAGEALCEDGLYSVQQVTAAVVDFGWFSHALHQWRVRSGHWRDSTSRASARRRD